MSCMKYMIIETFKPGKSQSVYQRLEAKGRMLPDGLEYLDSWLEENGHRCFQLMETAEADLFAEWFQHWQDLVDFEIVPLGSKPTE